MGSGQGRATKCYIFYTNSIKCWSKILSRENLHFSMDGFACCCCCCQQGMFSFKKKCLEMKPFQFWGRKWGAVCLMAATESLGRCWVASCLFSQDPLQARYSQDSSYQDYGKRWSGKCGLTRELGLWRRLGICSSVVSGTNFASAVFDQNVRMLFFNMSIFSTDN